MSHGKIREEKNCLNCGHIVEERFCPHCGQENIQPRQPFYYLFTHFIEDFTHYDGQFWKTIKYLLFQPGKLTKEYLSGKRQFYVAPVKLYIFISFITFFVPTLFSQSEDTDDEAIEKHSIQKDNKDLAAKIIDSVKSGIIVESNTKNDSIINKGISKLKNLEDVIDKKEILSSQKDQFAILGATSMKEYDSLSIKGGRTYTSVRPFAKKIFHLQDRGLKRKEIIARFVDTFIHSFPKALFIYLPVFAFFLWIFHNKKKWWYFDHGIFTLHYFSFLLSSTLIFILANHLIAVVPSYTIIKVIFGLCYTALFFYTCAYFFIAHHRVYENSKRASILKGSLLFIINCIGLLFMLMILTYISFVTMH
ncbi:hypothetical protein IQ37_01365 [Chryseobacterium piperi]|uniref:DUF3667 domain-containing protein n=1 Tax=Chryseobacterium piperi TaxID=558152 RepID=A0A086BLN6_9FLAO|nr:DUF3667 domain-containing protein [Chryseobacterium piperi]ASW75701.1 DUF3667 domain-containing protein [Chryseobacterium piperi]KFF29850.1 hypothetical protein IQ37_01365 [Chryseobacterium piperi]